jgi:hypothetical protein
MRKQEVAGLGMILLLAAGFSRADESSCLAGATTQGSFLSGRTVTARDEYPGVAVLDTFKRLNAFVLKDGWRINFADKELGTISASQDVTGSNGKQLNLNIIIESMGDAGSKATAAVKLGPGQVVVGPTLTKGLCGMLSGSSTPGR